MSLSKTVWQYFFGNQYLYSVKIGLETPIEPASWIYLSLSTIAILTGLFIFFQHKEREIAEQTESFPYFAFVNIIFIITIITAGTAVGFLGGALLGLFLFMLAVIIDAIIIEAPLLVAYIREISITVGIIGVLAGMKYVYWRRVQNEVRAQKAAKRRKRR